MRNTDFPSVCFSKAFRAIDAETQRSEAILQTSSFKLEAEDPILRLRHDWQLPFILEK